jgi:hypothetical protein
VAVVYAWLLTGPERSLVRRVLRRPVSVLSLRAA